MFYTVKFYGEAQVSKVKIFVQVGVCIINELDLIHVETDPEYKVDVTFKVNFIGSAWKGFVPKHMYVLVKSLSSAVLHFWLFLYKHPCIGI